MTTLRAGKMDQRHIGFKPKIPQQVCAVHVARLQRHVNVYDGFGYSLGVGV